MKISSISNKVIVTLLMCFTLNNIEAQTTKAPLTSVLPVSPEAGSLGKFVDQPVSHYTGIPQIDIPIHAIKKGDIEIDISLSYHAGGNKVDEIASRVGLGWTLNAGGVITRSARGLPDDPSSYFNYTAYNALSTEDRNEFLVNVSNGVSDSEPDIYYVNAGDLNVKIFKDNNNVWQTMPRDKNIKVQYNEEGHDWIITNGRGIRYKFSQKEFTASSNSSGTNDGSYYSGVSSWFLNQVEDTKGNVIDFVYEDVTYSFNTKNDESKMIPLSASCFLQTTVSVGNNSVLGVRLKYINFSDGKIELKYLPTPRLDQTLDYALSRVEIHSSSGLIKALRLFTSYFSSNNIGVSSPNVYSSADQYRLKLDSVREEFITEALKSYKFTYYNSNGLPYRNANSQDHWGYFNGQDNYGTSVNYMEAGLRKGAIKKVNWEYAKETILTKIQYPTGGIAEFEYEGNTYANAAEITGDEIPFDLVRLDGFNGYNHATYDNLTHTFTQTFTITSQQLLGGSMRILTEPSTLGVDHNCSCQVYMTLTQPDNTNIVLRHGTQEQFFLDQPGTYTFTGQIVTEFPNLPSITFSIWIKGYEDPQPGVMKNIIGPGLRVKSIKRTFSPGDVLNTYFDYADPGTGLSSGQLGNFPHYGREYTLASAADPNQWYSDQVCDYMIYSSNSNYSLINTKGGYVGYTYVTITEDQNGNLGKKVFRFTYDRDINAESSFPYPPNSPQDWKRGLPLEESVYKKTLAGFELVQSKRMRYEILPSSDITAYGVKVGIRTGNQFTAGDAVRVAGFSVTPYMLRTDILQLKADTTVVKEGSSEVVSDNLYQYSLYNNKVAEIRSTQSNGGKLFKKIYYPADYIINQGSSLLLSNMISKNLVDVPIEEITTTTFNGISKYVYGTAYEYGVNSLPSFNQFYLKKIYQANTVNANLYERYNFLNRPTHYEEKLHTVSVNAYGQPLQHILNGLQKVAYVWGYNNQHLIAEIKGADFATVELILGGQSAVETFANSNPTDAEVNVVINALRNSSLLKDAQITSYTYKPLVGVTSQTDVKGMTTYYEYDDFQRLMAVKDQNGHIVKSYDYHFKP